MRRPKTAPRKIPQWAWELSGWLDSGRKGPRPPDAPRFVPLWFHAWRRWRRNPAAIDPTHPHAPPSHPLPHAPVPPKSTDPFHLYVVYHANLGLKYAGRMVYTETAARSELFGRPVDGFAGAHADCSQYVSSILHWLGNRVVTKYDYTGTLLQKGKLVARPARGLVAVWGPGTGAHTAFITEHIRGGSDWYCVGFGHQGAPDRNTLSGMDAYFVSIGQPGVRFLDFAP